MAPEVFQPELIVVEPTRWSQRFVRASTPDPRVGAPVSPEVLAQKLTEKANLLYALGSDLDDLVDIIDLTAARAAREADDKVYIDQEISEAKQALIDAHNTYVALEQQREQLDEKLADAEVAYEAAIAAFNRGDSIA